MESEFIPISGGNGNGNGSDPTGKSRTGNGDRSSSSSTGVRIKLLTDVPAPWLRYETVDVANVTPLVRFHNEILSFCSYLTPTKSEWVARKSLYDEIRDILVALWPACHVCVFGSQLTSLLTTSSDMDIAVLDVPTSGGDVTEALYQIADVFRDRGLVTYLEVVPTAKVPIIKFDHKRTGISVDICVNNDSGLYTGALMRHYLQAYPPLRPLLLVLKTFLAQRNLAETYQGGIGSFVLCNIVLAFIQQRQQLAAFRRTPCEMNLACMLLDFLSYFTSSYNFVHTGLCVNRGGYLYSKRSRGAEFFAVNKPFALSVENPDHSLVRPMDIGKNSYMIVKVRRSLEHGLQLLTSALGDAYMESYLTFVIRPDDPKLANRPAPNPLQGLTLQVPAEADEWFNITPAYLEKYAPSEETMNLVLGVSSSGEPGNLKHGSHHGDNKRQALTGHNKKQEKEKRGKHSVDKSGASKGQCHETLSESSSGGESISDSSSNSNYNSDNNCNHYSKRARGTKENSSRGSMRDNEKSQQRQANPKSSGSGSSRVVATTAHSSETVYNNNSSSKGRNKRDSSFDRQQRRAVSDVMRVGLPEDGVKALSSDDDYGAGNFHRSSENIRMVDRNGGGGGGGGTSRNRGYKNDEDVHEQDVSRSSIYDKQQKRKRMV